MYTSFYGLREKPFSLTPDPNYLFLAESHREALAHILYGIEQGEGFIAITGEVGTGKTTLCRTLLQRLESDTEVAFVFNPTLTGVELLRAITLELGLEADGKGRAELVEQLNEFLLETNRIGRRVLLIIDEAQNLAPETLEEIRLFSNLETPTSKLIQILLFGQPELDEKLDSHELRQLRQRISVRWSLGPLTASETADYVSHRMTIAAGYQSEFFSAAALREIHRRTRGVPRLVNVICDRSLLAGFAVGKRQGDIDIVRQVGREMRGVDRSGSGRPWLRPAAVAVLLTALVVGAMAWLDSLESSGIQGRAKAPSPWDASLAPVSVGPAMRAPDEDPTKGQDLPQSTPARGLAVSKKENEEPG